MSLFLTKNDCINVCAAKHKENQVTYTNKIFIIMHTVLMELRTVILIVIVYNILAATPLESSSTSLGWIFFYV